MDSFKAIVARGNILLRQSPSTTSDPSSSNSNTNSNMNAATPAIPSSSNFDAAVLTPTMVDLIIVLLVLIFVAMLLVAALYVVRKIRRSRMAAGKILPRYEESSPNINRHTRSNSHRIDISAGKYGNNGSSVYVYDEKSSMMKARDKEMGGSSNGVPEIRITFPDEQDESGRLKSGRVVVVRVTDTGVGLEPLKAKEESLPAYEKEMGGGFHSIDMERIGGLKEKSEWS